MKPIIEGNYYRHPIEFGDSRHYFLCSNCELIHEQILDREETPSTGLIHCTECSKGIAIKEEVIGYPKYDWTGRLSLVYYCQTCLARVQEKGE